MSGNNYATQQVPCGYTGHLFEAAVPPGANPPRFCCPAHRVLQSALNAQANGNALTDEQAAALDALFRDNLAAERLSPRERDAAARAQAHAQRVNDAHIAKVYGKPGNTHRKPWVKPSRPLPPIICPQPYKKVYRTREEALAFIEVAHPEDENIRPYKCRCGALHIGHPRVRDDADTGENS